MEKKGENKNEMEVNYVQCCKKIFIYLANMGKKEIKKKSRIMVFLTPQHIFIF